MPETRERKKVTEGLCSRTGKSQGGENAGLQDCSVTSITYRLDKSLPLSFMDAMPGFLPTSSSSGVGGIEIQLLHHANYRPKFCNMDTWTLHTGYGLQTHLTGKNIFLLSQTGHLEYMSHCKCG